MAYNLPPGWGFGGSNGGVDGGPMTMDRVPVAPGFQTWAQMRQAGWTRDPSSPGGWKPPGGAQPTNDGPQTGTNQNARPVPRPGRPVSGGGGQYGVLPRPNPDVGQAGGWNQGGQYIGDPGRPYNGGYLGGSQYARPVPRPGRPVSGGGGQTATPTVNTSINPTGIYTNQMSQEAVNQARASQLGPGDMAWMNKQMGGSGQGMGSGSVLSRAIPQISQGISAGAQAGGAIPFQDAVANAQHLLSGQQARDDEFFGMAGIPIQQQAQQNNILMQLLNMFMGMGGIGG